jgi:hypothetical protein
VEPFIQGAWKQSLLAAQPLEVIGNITSEVADRAVHSAGRPEDDRKRVRVVERLRYNPPGAPEVPTRLLR